MLHRRSDFISEWKPDMVADDMTHKDMMIQIAKWVAGKGGEHVIRSNNWRYRRIKIRV